MCLSYAVATKNGLKSRQLLTVICSYLSQKRSVLRELRYTGHYNSYQLMGEVKNPCKFWGISQHRLRSKTQSSHSFEIRCPQQFIEWWKSFQLLKEIYCPEIYRALKSTMVYCPVHTRGAVIRKGNALVDIASNPVSYQLVVKITAIALDRNLRSSVDHPRKL